MAHRATPRTHNTGAAWRTGTLADPGAGVGAFKTPTLRDVPLTAPYMHDGSLPTLTDVIDFYDRGGVPNPALDKEIAVLRLSSREKEALLAFLQALMGEASH